MPKINKELSTIYSEFTPEEEFTAFTFTDAQLAALETEIAAASTFAIAEQDPKLTYEQQLTVMHYNRGRLAGLKFVVERHYTYMAVKIREIEAARREGTLG